MDKTISLQTAIDALYKHFDKMIENGHRDNALGVSDSIFILGTLPSAQPEIIRCKDCKYRDENWRRVSVRWLPCMDVRTGSNWYCGSAERGEQDGRDD